MTRLSSLIELIQASCRLSAIILSADSSAERLSATSANALPADHVEDVKDTLEDLKIIRWADFS
jgi:hypothetical protein